MTGSGQVRGDGGHGTTRTRVTRHVSRIPTVCVTDAQREAPVDVARIGRLTRCAVRSLGIRTRGMLAVTFIGTERMRRLNRRFLRHDRPTDVLSFRYDGAPIVGEILIAPGVARAYATRHRLPYLEELGRYVVHGLLHWLGHDDRTPAQRRAMRLMEDRLLVRCGVR